jgi:FKBP-type peptidyl-prolyl cis-trans isomerase FkpA
MEREQLLKVMIPVGAFALLLILVGVVIALNSGGGTPSTAAVNTPGGTQATTPEMPNRPTPAAVAKYDFPLDGPEWKEVVGHPGLKYWDVRIGDGKECPPGASVTAQYTGWRPDGFSFDNPAQHGGPQFFSLSGVVAGWTHGIPGMKVGGTRRLYIPSAMGYGVRGRPPSIPGNTDLIFEIELVTVS